MRLTELEASFVKITDEGQQGRTMKTDVAMAEADGVYFLCPKCFASNGGRVGTHMVLCWFRGKVGDQVEPGPGRWNPAGAGLEDLTFVGPGSVSVLLLSGCGLHGFVRDGEATLS